MRKKFFSILLTLVLVLSFSLVAAVPVAADTITVGPTMSTPAINEAIAGASDGDVVQFEDGTYILTEQLSVGVEGVTLQGNMTNPGGVVLEASSVAKGIIITANGVAIKGLKVENSMNRGIDIYASVDNIAIDSVIASGNNQGINVESGYTVNNLAVNKVVCTNNVVGLKIAAGVHELTVTNSKFNNNGDGGGIFSSGNLDGISVDGSTFTGNAFGIMLGAESQTAQHIKNVDIENCTFDNNNKNPDYTLGFWVYVYGSTDHVIENIQVHYCSFTNHNNYGVGFDNMVGSGYADVLIDATNNWWGTKVESAIAGMVSGNVNYTSWLDAPITNTVVGVAALTEQITAINVGPTSIDFGTITPGAPVPVYPITVTNKGSVTVDVSASLDPTGGVFQYLFLNTVNRPNTGSWSAGDLGIVGLAPTHDAPCITELRVPLTYSARGEETAQIVFIATYAP